MYLWDRTTLHNVGQDLTDNTESVIMGQSTLHHTDYVHVGQEYTAQCRLCTCRTQVHCTIQTMYMWNRSTLHNADYVLVGHKYTAPYRLCTCGTGVHALYRLCTCAAEVHCPIQIYSGTVLHCLPLSLLSAGYNYA